MDWTEGTMGDQPVGPKFHVPVSSSKSCLLSTSPVSKKQTTDVSTITDPIPPTSSSPTPTSPYHSPTFPSHFPASPSSQSHPFQQTPQRKTKKSLVFEVCNRQFTRSNDHRDHKISDHKWAIPRFVSHVPKHILIKEF